MKASAILLVAACGRVGFEPLDASVDAPLAPCVLGAFGISERVAGINSVSDEWSASLTGDELAITFTSWLTGGSRIWSATRLDRATTFDPPMEIVEVSSTSSDFTPMFSRDGRTLIIASNRPGGVGSYDLWQFSRPTVTTPFGNSQPIAELNSVYYDAKAWLSEDGLRIYFDSQRTGLGDLYVATRLSPTDTFSPPAVISEISSSSRDANIALSRDELEVYFTSARPGGQGLLDIWFARRTAIDQPFGIPENLAIVNTPNDDLANWLSEDGRTFYHNRDANELGGGSADIWLTRRDCVP